MRAFRLLLAIALLGVSPPPAVTGGDRVPELVGSWTCRNPAGVLSTVTYRSENGAIVADEKTPGSPGAVHDRFRPDPGGGWHVDRDTAYGRFSGYGPPWTVGPWIITDAQKHGTEIRYQRTVDGTLWRVLSIAGRPYAGEVCAKGAEQPDPDLCAVHNLPVLVLHAAEPETPQAAMENRIQGRVDVLVSVDAAGHVVDAVVKQSPSVVLNAASIAAARASTYRPALHDCRPVRGEYLFAVDYGMR
jgi:TonB family protein